MVQFCVAIAPSYVLKKIKGNRSLLLITLLSHLNSDSLIVYKNILKVLLKRTIDLTNLGLDVLDINRSFTLHRQ